MWIEQERGISTAVLRRNRVSMVYRPPPAAPSIAFPYYQGGHVVNIKYRALDKRFSQVKGGSQVFYGINDLQVCVDSVTQSAASVYCRPLLLVCQATLLVSSPSVMALFYLHKVMV
jgi:hypothetical protein